MAKRAANIVERSLPKPPKTADVLITLHQHVNEQLAGPTVDPIHGTLLAQAAAKKPSGTENVERTALKNFWAFLHSSVTHGL